MQELIGNPYVPECVFCKKVQEMGSPDPLAYVHERVFDFEPLNPVTPGHRLFIHRYHTCDATENPYLAAEVFAKAAQYAEKKEISCNIITSVGAEATQTIFHTHIHVVPRREGDGLHLPWTNQVKN